MCFTAELTPSTSWVSGDHIAPVRRRRRQAGTARCPDFARESSSWRKASLNFLVAGSSSQEQPDPSDAASSAATARRRAH
eukprot:9821173-Alexandrium_andersonii.AAC.1